MTLVKKIKDKKVNFEFNKEFIKVVTDKISSNDAEFITNSFNDMHPADAADIIEHLNENDRESLIKLNNFKVDPEVFVELNESIQSELIAYLSSESIVNILKNLESDDAIKILENVDEIHAKERDELIWILEHKDVYTAGTSYKDNELLDKSINLIKTNRGGKITYHGPGQLIFYFVIDLNKREKNIRKLISSVENTIINTLKEFNIKVFADRKNIGIWHKRKFDNKIKIEKVAAIGIKVKKWIAYHGFALNVSNNLNAYTKIIPCGIKDKEITNLIKIKKQKYNNISEILIEKFLKEIKN